MFCSYAVIAAFEGALIRKRQIVDCAVFLCLCCSFSQSNAAEWIKLNHKKALRMTVIHFEASHLSVRFTFERRYSFLTTCADNCQGWRYIKRHQKTAFHKMASSFSCWVEHTQILIKFREHVDALQLP